MSLMGKTNYYNGVFNKSVSILIRLRPEVNVWFDVTHRIVLEMYRNC